MNLNNPYICRENLVDMGVDRRNNLVEEFYQRFLRQLLMDARNGNYFTRFAIPGENWSIVNALYNRILSEHPGVHVRNLRNDILGFSSEIEVRWD